MQELWRQYCEATGTAADRLEAAEQLGDSPGMADELLELVLAGTKTATAGLVRDFDAAGAPLPSLGGHWVVLDGRGRPAAVLRTVETRVGVLGSVDDAFAFDEGEGDRTRASWLDGHRRYFTRQGERQGFAFDAEHEPVLFERFELVWRAPRHS